MESATNFNYMKELESIKKDLDGMKKELEENKSNDQMQTKYEIGREYIFIFPGRHVLQCLEKNGFIVKDSDGKHATCKMCDSVYPKDQLTNSDPSKNHIYKHLRKIAEGTEFFQQASQNTADRVKAYDRHYIWSGKENRKKEYTDPSSEADLKCIHY